MSIIGSFSPITEGTGTGSPEGKIAAPVGSVYTDTAATNGAIRWIKTSGTGNTGWRVEHGDTGWRDITSSITDRSTPLEFADEAGLYIRRVQDTVHYRISGGTTIVSQFGKLSDTFDGFRPTVSWYIDAISRYADLKVGIWQIRIENGVSGESLGRSKESRVVQWPTVETWPATLPGIPS